MTSLQNIALWLINKWLTVYSHRDGKHTWFSYSDGTNVWYIQHGTWYGFSISRSNIPHKDVWSGCTVYEGTVWTDEEIIDRCISALYRHTVDSIHEYKNATQFVNHQRKHWKNYDAITIGEIDLFIW